MIEGSLRIPAGAAGEFTSPGSTFYADSYFGIRSTPVLLQEQVKDPGHNTRSAGGRLQLNTHAPYVCGLHEVMMMMMMMMMTIAYIALFSALEQTHCARM